MKIYLGLILLLLISFNSFSQAVNVSKTQHFTDGIIVDSFLYLPTGCGVPTDSTFLHDKSGTKKAAKYYDSCGNNEYVWNPALKTWKLGSSNSIDSITKLNDSTALLKRPNGNPDTLVIEGNGTGGYQASLSGKSDSSAALLNKGSSAPADTLYVLGNTAKLSRLNDSTALLNHGDATNDTLMIQSNGTGGYVSSLTQLDSTRALLNHGNNTNDTLQIISSSLDTVSYPSGLTTKGSFYKVLDSLAATISLSGSYTNGTGIIISGGSINADTSGIVAAKNWVSNLFQLKGNWALKSDTSSLNLSARFALYQPAGNYAFKTDTSLLNLQARYNLYQPAGSYALKTDTTLLNLAARFGLYQPAGSYLTSASLSGYATQSWVSSQGYLTYITSTLINSALGYTPYNSTNPAGYITSSALTGYLPLSAGSSYPLTGVLYINHPSTATFNGIVCSTNSIAKWATGTSVSAASDNFEIYNENTSHSSLNINTTTDAVTLAGSLTATSFSGAGTGLTGTTSGTQ